MRADPEAVSRHPCEFSCELVFVEAPAAKDLHITAPVRVQDGADFDRQLCQVTTVQPYTADMYAFGAKLVDQAGCRLRRFDRVIGIDQQDRALGIHARKVFEGRELRGMRLDEGMRHRAVDRDAVCRVGEHRRRSRETGDVGCASGHQAGFCAVCPAQPEVDQQFARRSQHATGRLGRDQGLEVNEIDQPGLDQLRLGQRRDDLHDGLVGKERRALRHGADIASEAKVGEIVDQARFEALRRLQVADVFVREAKPLEEVEQLFEPGRQQEIAGLRQASREELENRFVVHPAVDVGVQHGELVEIGQQTAVAETEIRPVHPGSRENRRSPRPALPVSRWRAGRPQRRSPGWHPSSR